MPSENVSKTEVLWRIQGDQNGALVCHGLLLKITFPLEAKVKAITTISKVYDK